MSMPCHRGIRCLYKAFKSLILHFIAVISIDGLCTSKKLSLKLLDVRLLKFKIRCDTFKKKIQNLNKINIKH